MPKIIVVSGTPGTGKTVIAKLLAEELGACYVNLSEMVLKEKLYVGYDESRGSYIVDEERVRSRLRELVKDCNILVVDGHYGEIAPREYVDKVIVLRTDPLELEERLRRKNWSWEKIRENIAAEILGVCTVNALEEQGADKVYEVDTTNRSPQEVVKEIIEEVLTGKKPSGPRIDWLTLKPLEVIERYLK